MRNARSPGSNLMHGRKCTIKRRVTIRSRCPLSGEGTQFLVCYRYLLSTGIAMATLLENFMITHPDVTLSHTNYGRNFYLGSGVNILSSPAQRLQSFVENEGNPYRFMIVGQLASFKVVEGSVCSHILHALFIDKIVLFDAQVWTFSFGLYSRASITVCIHRDL